MATPRQHHLEQHLRRLEQQRQQTKRHLRALARQTQQALRHRCGALVELAGLAHLDPGTLLGGLCALAAQLAEPDTITRWKQDGEQRLAEYHRRKARRQRSSRMDAASRDPSRDTA